MLAGTGNGRYNREHDTSMERARRQAVFEVFSEEHNRNQFTRILQEIRNNIIETRGGWDEINLRGRHPDNVSSDIIDAFSRTRE